MTSLETARFTITYSRNCDGGLQELSAAAQCIREVFPDSQIVASRVNAYPIRVTIVVECDSMAEGKTVVWSGKQQNLFEKYPTRRSKCLQLIKCKLHDLLRNEKTQHQQNHLLPEEDENQQEEAATKIYNKTLSSSSAIAVRA